VSLAHYECLPVLIPLLPLPCAQEDRLITMAFGPGVTVEYAVLEHTSVPAKAPRGNVMIPRSLSATAQHAGECLISSGIV
jgi:hypothetical protein